jgi:hypothetical protein
MRLFRCLVPALAALCTQSAAADTRAEVTALIRAGDRDAVMAALANRDRAEQRAAFAAFQTARADVARMTEALLDAHPDDPRAMAARGWHLQSLGWAMRGQNVIRHTYPPALARMDEFHGEGYALAQAALAADPALFPASDLLLSLSRTTGNRDIIPAELDRAMALWPNRQSMILAIGGMTPNWGGPEGWGYETCARYAARIADVPGYTEEICQVDILFAAPYPANYQRGVYDLIPALDHPILDEARFARAMSGMVPADDAIATLEGFLATGELGLTGAGVLDDLRGQAMPIIGGPAVAQVFDGALQRQRDQADFNPGDGDALRRYTDALGIQTELRGTRFPRDEIVARYAARFAVAPYDGETWARYGELMASGVDWNALDPDGIAEVRAIFQNGVYYTNHSSRNLRALDHFNRTVWQWLDQHMMDPQAPTNPTTMPDDQFDAQIVCPTVRSIRLLTAVCEEGQGQLACPHPDDPSDPAFRLFDRAAARGACSAEFNDPVEALAYDLTPVEVPSAP